MTNHNRQDFERMIKKYLDGTATSEERNFLEAYYESLDKHADILSQFTDNQKDGLEYKMEQFLQDHLENTATKIIPFWKRPWMRAAAAAVLIFGMVSIAFFRFESKKTVLTSKKQTAPSDFAPGEDKAILTLADGSSIALDGKSNGQIAVQGKVEIKKSEEGQLVYGYAKDGDNGASEPQINTVSTPAGGQYRIVLPDGSKVWLNAKSSLRFPTFFTGNERRVAITGECYFEIAKNTGKPFSVHVNGKQEVIVTGTHFNVNSYKDEPAIRTTLLEGSVNVRSMTGNMLQLKPGEQSSLAAAGGFRVTKVDVEEAVAWKNGLFQFQNTSLENVMRQVARWYNVEVTYEKNVPDKTFSGKIHRDANASQILEILKFAGVNFRMEAGEKDGTTGRIVVMQ